MNEHVAQTLIDLVVEMRESQNIYFKTRDKESLIRAKQAEYKVDSFIKSVTAKSARRMSE